MVLAMSTLAFAEDTMDNTTEVITDTDTGTMPEFPDGGTYLEMPQGGMPFGGMINGNPPTLPENTENSADDNDSAE